MDVVIPRMRYGEGHVLTRAFPSLPILFTSGYSESTAAPASVLTNAFYLQKPYSPTALGRVMRKILDPGREATEGTI